MEPPEDIIAAARGEVEADLVIVGADVINTHSGEAHRSDVAIYCGRIVSFSPASAKETIDLSGRLIAPGFIDGHVHIESAMVTLPEYARAVVPRGTTSVVIDPHEIANVLGAAGVRYMIRSSRSVPLNVLSMIPSCVPATDMETSGAVLDADDIEMLLNEEGVMGLAEVMNFPGVVHRHPGVMVKLAIARGKIIDGHCPGLSGRDLDAYVAAGIGSDHECTTTEEALGKLRRGMTIMIREGSAAKNLEGLLPLVNPKNSSNFIFVSDDRHPTDIQREGHIDFMVRKAVHLGLDPVTAIQIATLNAARYFGLHDLGAIAPGYRADIAVLDDVDGLNVIATIKDGKVVAEGGRMLVDIKGPRSPASALRIEGLRPSSFDIEARSDRARVIGVVPGQIVTRSLVEEVRVDDGRAAADPDRDMLKMAVIERHRGTGRVGIGFVSGFAFHSGAIATSVAHDSHNVSVVGASSKDMLAAALAVRDMNGGLAVADGGKVLASLPLPVAGLISEKPMEEVAEGMKKVTEAASALGCSLGDPFMALSFLSLPVIPELKLTDRGLIDVNQFRFVPLFVEEP